MQTLIMSSAGATPGRYFIGYANSFNLVPMPQGVTPQTFATEMRGGGQAFLSYLRQSGLPDAATAQVQAMYSASSAFRYEGFEYAVAEETASLWTEVETLGAELAEFL